jgi:hypothetical protein
MLTEKDYCDYTTSVALKELGYVGICDAYYELTGSEDYNRDSFELLYTRDFIHPDDIDRVAAPLLYQAQKFLREEKGVIVDTIINFTTQEFDYFVSTWAEDRCRGNEYTTYENALLRGIKEAVKILKEDECTYCL